MNIIIVYDYGYVNGGAAQVAINSAIALKGTGHHVAYFCAVGPVDEKLSEVCDEAICTHQRSISSDFNIVKKSVQGIWNVKARSMLKQFLSGYSPSDTVVHFHGWFKALSPSVVAVPDRMGFASCITLHDFFVYCPNGGLYNYQQNTVCDILPMTKACLCCHCDRDNYGNKIWRYVRNYVQNIELRKLKRICFVSISEISEREFRRCYPFDNGRLVKVNNPVKFSEIGNIHRQNADCYLYMGRLSKEKGADLFCQAITRLDLKGVVLGEGPMREQLARDYPEIEFAGWVSGKDKEKYFSRTRAFVFSSVWLETFGLSVAEMLSLGIPCVVGDKTAAAELIKDGIDGYLYEMGNVESMMRVIKKIETQKCTVGEVVFDKSKYSMDNHVSALMTLYNNMLILQ